MHASCGAASLYLATRYGISFKRLNVLAARGLLFLHAKIIILKTVGRRQDFGSWCRFESRERGEKVARIARCL